VNLEVPGDLSLVLRRRDDDGVFVFDTEARTD
jgi:hypothetical protein